MKWRATALRVFGGAVLIALLAWFAYANSGQAVDLRLGIFTLRGLSLPVVVYGAVIVGMLLMIVVSLRGDLHTRRALDRYDKIAADVLRDIEGPSADKEGALGKKSDET